MGTPSRSIGQGCTAVSVLCITLTLLCSLCEERGKEEEGKMVKNILKKSRSLWDFAVWHSLLVSWLWSSVWVGVLCTWAPRYMSNVAALCYSDAIRWWVTHPFLSSHTHALDDCTSISVSQLSAGVTWKSSLMWVEHKISAASGYKRPGPTRLYSDWLRNSGGYSDSAAAL